MLLTKGHSQSVPFWPQTHPWLWQTQIAVHRRPGSPPQDTVVPGKQQLSQDLLTDLKNWRTCHKGKETLINADLIPEIIPHAKEGPSRNVSRMDVVEKQTCFLYFSVRFPFPGWLLRAGECWESSTEDNRAAVNLDPWKPREGKATPPANQKKVLRNKMFVLNRWVSYSS